MGEPPWSVTGARFYVETDTVHTPVHRREARAIARSYVVAGASVARVVVYRRRRRLILVEYRNVNGAIEIHTPTRSDTK